VYINLTRGQNSLAMDVIGSSSAGEPLPRVDLSSFALPVMLANDQELSEHQTMLVDIDKASKGATIWRLATSAA